MTGAGVQVPLDYGYITVGKSNHAALELINNNPVKWNDIWVADHHVKKSGGSLLITCRFSAVKLMPGIPCSRD